MKLIDFEMVFYYFSAAKHLTLLESNAFLVSLFDPHNNKEKDERNDLLLSEIKLLQLNADQAIFTIDYFYPFDLAKQS